SMQELLNNSSSDLGIPSEFRSAAGLRFKAFNTQISDLQDFFDKLATQTKPEADELPSIDLALSSTKDSNTSKQSEPSSRMEVVLSPKDASEKKQTIAPSKELNEPEETARWIEELRQRKSSKKLENPSKGNESQCDSSDELLRQQHLQEELAGSLVSMAGILKSNSLAFGDALNKDEQVLDEAQAALDTNLDRLTAEGRRLKLISSSASSATLLYYLSILLVVMVFIMTAVYIRLNPKLK
ncbi:SNAP receptor use1, partial [Entomophthora muscae]